MPDRRIHARPPAAKSAAVARSSAMRAGRQRAAGSATRKTKIVASRMSTTPASTLDTSAAIAAAPAPTNDARKRSARAARAQAPSSSSALRVLARSAGRSARSASPRASATAMATAISPRSIPVTLTRASELRLDPVAQPLQRLDAREELVVGGDHVPRRGIGRGALDHVVHRARVGGPLLAVAPVLGGDLEALVRDVLARLEAAQLLGGRDGQPELGDDGAGLGELLLELVDLAVGAHPVELGAELLHALHQHAPVPGAVEDRRLAVSRDVAPEAPQVRLRAFFVGRRGHRDHSEEARVHGLREAPDGAALAR